MSEPGPSRRELAAWLRDAYAGGGSACPPPEAYLADEMAALTAEQRQRLEAHADACAACGAERELARAFDADADADTGAGMAAAAAEDVDWVVARLRGEPAAAAEAARPPTPPDGMPPPPRVVPFRGRRVRVWTRLAAAAVLVVAAGLTLQTLDDRRPSLPEPPSGGVVRGGDVEVLAPAGEVAEPPGELQWQPVADASGYRVRLTAVDDTVLWESGATAPPARLPDEVKVRLQRAVTYQWMVEATAPDGSTLGRSAPARFRIAPLPEPTARGVEGR